MDIDVNKNFRIIYDTLVNSGTKRTEFAKAMGYSSTTQLASTLEGEAMISTRAIIELIKIFKINPTFLFTGQGEIYLNDEDELKRLQHENHVLAQNHDAAVKTVKSLYEEIRKMEQKYVELIDITTAAIKYNKEHKEEEFKIEDEESSLNTNKK